MPTKAERFETARRHPLAAEQPTPGVEALHPLLARAAEVVVPLQADLAKMRQELEKSDFPLAGRTVFLCEEELNRIEKLYRGVTSSRCWTIQRYQTESRTHW